MVLSALITERNNTVFMEAVCMPRHFRTPLPLIVLMITNISTKYQTLMCANFNIISIYI